jgi:hypothetical protein
MNAKILNKITLIAMFICACCHGQTSDYIVSASQDTIYVDKISLTDFEVKTKTADKKKKYAIDEITSYYISKENKHYERVPLEKKVLKDPDKYDYKRNENISFEEYANRKKYKFIQRLTTGKVKLFREDVRESSPGMGSPGQPGFTPSTPSDSKIYYISIYDSKLEVIKSKEELSLFNVSKGSELKLFNNSSGFELNKEVYDILKIYLYGNNEINVKLDHLFLSKPIAKEKQIVDLINEYNKWARLNN